MASFLSLRLEQLIGALTPNHKKRERMMTQNVRFVGIDVGKFEFHINCLWNGVQKRFANNAQGHNDLNAMLGDERDMVLAVEPTGG